MPKKEPPKVKSDPDADKDPPSQDKKAGRGNQGQRPKGGQPSKFEGQCPELAGHIFDCSDGRQVNKYVVTLRELAYYVGQNYSYGSNIRWTILKEKKATIPMPADLPATGGTRAEIRVWEKKVDEVVKREAQLEENCRAAYALVLGQ